MAFLRINAIIRRMAHHLRHNISEEKENPASSLYGWTKGGREPEERVEERSETSISSQDILV